MRVQLFLLWIVLSLVQTSTAFAEERELTYGNLRAVAWFPDQSFTTPSPVLLFSHGFHGCATQSRYLTTGLAAAGYIVIAPDHADAVCHDGPSALRYKSDEPFRTPENWTDQTYQNRADDLRHLIQAAQADPAFAGKADWSRLGLMGHSLGGYTVLGLGGAWPSWRLESVKAILALSPYALPFNLHGALHDLSAPVMYLTGTRDRFIKPFLRGEKGTFEQSPVPKFYVVFEGARHLSFSDRGSDQEHKLILAYSLGFLDMFLKGEPMPTFFSAKGRFSI